MAIEVAIVGASGFVGSTLVEFLAGNNEFHVVSFIHRNGSAARLARKGIQFKPLDLLDKVALRKTINRFDMVVNCSRGGKSVMLEGLDNLLAACHKSGVKRFVHLSSVAVYGDPPHPKSSDESAPTNPEPGTYGWLKLEQDRKVLKASNEKLQTVILCPPNISGPYSSYLTGLIESIESGRFRLLDDGSLPINLVDVRNLSWAIVCALKSQSHTIGRYFICDDEPITWKDICDELGPVLRADKPIGLMPSDLFSNNLKMSNNYNIKRTGNAIMHLASDEVRAALRLNKQWANIEIRLRKIVASLGKNAEKAVRQTVSGPIRIPKMSSLEPLDRPLISQQLRRVRHSSARARRELGYEPLYSIHDSFEAFRNWYGTYCNINSYAWKLLAKRIN